MKMQRFKSHWLTLLATATWILTVTGTFLIQPPAFGRDQDANYQMLLRFLIAGLLALFFIPIRRNSGKKYERFWRVISAVAFISSLVLLVTYIVIYDQWSVSYADTRLTIGTHLLPSAQIKWASLPHTLGVPSMNNTLMVLCFEGKTGDIWPIEEIRSHYVCFAILYLLENLFFALFIISAAKAIDCNQNRK
jgi:cytochrome b subunit of formate dehydrogenase